MSNELNGRAFWRMADLSVALLFAATCFQLYYCTGDIRWYAENNLFELSQDAFLCGGAVLFFSAALWVRDRVSRLALLALTMFCLSILFREMDVRGTNLDSYLDYAFQHRWHYAFLGVLWLAIFFLSLRHFRLSVIYILRWVLGIAGALMIVGILFYVLGDVAEKHLFSGNEDLSEMIEESMEQLGTLFIFLSGYVTLRRLNSRRTS
ncbi:MAG: hypothetical protein K8R18_13460 [Parvibaculum sp.]|uniref:hypothetical protein n=1 Tax=Parvibaculum sp. TaxID=2024848 RepID=UPI0025DB6B13|nr:hypothetical protein [Parvibaculum sp.]MCE9650623.1 hypothetical protein [Parvibaculum sp.]